MQGIGSRELQTFDPDHRVFLDIMHHAAERNFFRISFQAKKWPMPESGKLELENFHFLDDQSYIADYNVCFVSSLHDVGPEVAHLIFNRRRRALMLLIVSDQPVMNESTEEVRRGICAISTSDFQRSKGDVMIPTMYEGMAQDAESGGAISFFYVRDRANARERLELMLL
jgi:hypothetical protein